MLDFSAYNIRKFEVKINEKELNILPPKLNQVDKINEFAKKFRTKGVSTQEMADTAVIVLNRNDKSERFEAAFVEELEYDIVYSIIFDYIAWVNEIHKNPNSDSPSVEQ